MLPKKHWPEALALAPLPSNYKDGVGAMLDPLQEKKNTHQDICKKCFNVLEVIPDVLACNFYGCRARVPIQIVTKCPKGEF